MILREVASEGGEEDVREVDIKINPLIKETKNGTPTESFRIVTKTETNSKTKGSKVFRTTDGKKMMISRGKNLTTVTILTKNGTQTKTITTRPKDMKALTTIDGNKKESPKMMRKETIIWARLEAKLPTMMKILIIER